jgi:hypothetical protein
MHRTAAGSNNKHATQRCFTEFSSHGPDHNHSGLPSAIINYGTELSKAILLVIAESFQRPYIVSMYYFRGAAPDVSTDNGHASIARSEDRAEFDPLSYRRFKVNDHSIEFKERSLLCLGIR